MTQNEEVDVRSSSSGVQNEEGGRREDRKMKEWTKMKP
jgi:hypothetical protein